MKFILALLLLSTTCLAEETTKTEKFISQTDNVIIQGYEIVGTMRGMNGMTIMIIAKEFHDIETGVQDYGVGISIANAANSYSNSETYIKYDKISSLIKGLSYLSTIDESASKLPNFQAAYSTTDGFSAILHSREDQGTQIAIKCERHSSSMAYIPCDSLGELINLIKKAKSRIDAIKY